MSNLKIFIGYSFALLCGDGFAMNSDQICSEQSDALVAKDPGVREINYGTGMPLANLNDKEKRIFYVGLQRFQEVEATSEEFQDLPVGTIAPDGKTNSAGLSGRFNSNQCSSCHAFPTIGGTSPAQNPLFKVYNARGAQNKMPYFNLIDGPIREARMIYDEDGFRHNGVINLFTLKGRYDAPRCQLEQPDFDKLGAEHNLAFRIPTPIFGLGLVESIPDMEILSHMRSNIDEKRALGIMGHPNRSGHTSTINRFGWKAQNESLMMFSGEAYNVEMGISNELFPTSRTEDSGSIFGEPFDVMRISEDGDFAPEQNHASWILFAMFMRLSAPPAPAPFSTYIENGQKVFKEVGCALCHVPTMRTNGTENGGSKVRAQAGQDVNLYSDLLVHQMGAGLADNIIQGQAGPDEFRTAPLWGLGQRIFFLHDGRAEDLDEAILAHYSEATLEDKDRRRPAFAASEANAVIRRYRDLNPSDRQALLDFLRAL